MMNSIRCSMPFTKNVAHGANHARPQNTYATNVCVLGRICICECLGL
jgi:hypothetical protein